MKSTRKLFYILTLLLTLLSGCSPFGNETVIGSIGSIIDRIFEGKASTEVVSGATQMLDTNPTSPAQNYKLSVAVGGQMSQTSTETSGGYKVYTTVQGSVTQ